MVNLTPKMILAVKTSLGRRKLPQAGFSLLEIIFVIGLIGILVSLSVVVYNPDSKSERIKRAAVKMEAMAARGHTMAKLHQQPFWLRFERNRVVLQGAAIEEASPALESADFDSTAEPAGDERGGTSPVTFDSFTFPEDVEVFLRRWGAPEVAWFHQEKKEEPALFWNFGPNGLCEPISIRFEIDNSWAVLEMDPLTGRVSEETSEIYDR